MGMGKLHELVKFDGVDCPKKKENERKLRDLRVRISNSIDKNKNALYVDLKDTSVEVNDRLISEGYEILLVTDDEQIVITWD